MELANSHQSVQSFQSVLQMNEVWWQIKPFSHVPIKKRYGIETGERGGRQ